MERQDRSNRDEAKSVQCVVPLRIRPIGRSMPAIRSTILVLLGGVDTTRELDRRHARRNCNPPSLYDCHHSVLHVGSQPRPRNTATARR